GSASLVYSTYLGGSGFDGYPNTTLRPLNQGIGLIFDTQGPAIAVDSSGNAYVAGSTNSTNFPTTVGAYESSLGSLANGNDAFVTELNATGSGLVYSTYLGPYSPGVDYYAVPTITRATSITVDGSGNATVAGLTRSGSYPTKNPIQGSLGGSSKKHPDVLADAFVTTLNATGSGLQFSTYLGGSGDDFGVGLARDSSGNLYVGGVSASSDFPTTAGAYETTPPFGNGGYAGFVSKIGSPYSPVLAPLGVA